LYRNNDYVPSVVVFFFDQSVVVVERSNVVLGARGDEPIRQKGSAKGGVGGTAARASSVMGGGADQHVSGKFNERIAGAPLDDFSWSRNRLISYNSRYSTVLRERE